MEHPELRDIMDNPATPRAVFIPQEVLRETMAALVGVPFYIGAGAGAILAIADGQGWGGVILGMGIVGLIGAGLGAIAGYALRQWWQGNIRRQLDKGGLVLWVNISRPQQEGRAWKILSRNHARFVHVHDIPTA
jgi:uncharacterized membrane protein YebE (DUF533 family)